VHHLRGRLARPDEAAQRRLVELTKSMPELVEAWRLRLDHAAQTDATDDEIDGLALEAFAKTRSHVFEHAAGHAERRRARSAPPSPAAALVRDVVRRLEESPNAVVSPDGRLDAALEAQLAELAPTARHAARAAIIVELGIASRWPELRAFFGRVAREATKAELGELFFAFAFIPDDAADRPLAGQIQALSTSGLASPEALRDAFDGALAGRHRQAASAAVVALAPHVRSSELTRLRKLLGTIHGAQPPRQAIDRWDDVLDRMHAELQPGYSLESAVYGDDVDDGPGDHDEGDDGSPFADMTAQVDEALRRASPAERARLLRELSKIVAGKAVPAEGDLARIAQLVASMNAPGKRQTQ